MTGHRPRVANTPASFRNLIGLKVSGDMLAEIDRRRGTTDRNTWLRAAISMAIQSDEPVTDWQARAVAAEDALRQITAKLDAFWDGHVFWATRIPQGAPRRDDHPERGSDSGTAAVGKPGGTDILPNGMPQHITHTADGSGGRSLNISMGDH